MNSIHSQSIDELANSNDLARTLKIMEYVAIAREIALPPSGFSMRKKNYFASEPLDASETLPMKNLPSTTIRAGCERIRAACDQKRAEASNHPSKMRARCERIRARARTRSAATVKK